MNQRRHRIEMPRPDLRVVCAEGHDRVRLAGVYIEGDRVSTELITRLRPDSQLGELESIPGAPKGPGGMIIGVRRRQERWKCPILDCGLDVQIRPENLAGIFPRLLPVVHELERDVDGVPLVPLTVLAVMVSRRR